MTWGASVGRLYCGPCKSRAVPLAALGRSQGDPYRNRDARNELRRVNPAEAVALGMRERKRPFMKLPDDFRSSVFVHLFPRSDGMSIKIGVMEEQKLARMDFDIFTGLPN
jgi:hypothetical protein